MQITRRLLIALALTASTLVAIGAIGMARVAVAQAEPVPDWPDLYDPFTLLSFNLRMAPEDWDTISADTTFDIEVPALLWAEDEAPILVSVRRKSASALPSEEDPQKVSLKIDINEYHDGDGVGNCEINGGFDNAVCVKTYKGVKKMSWENGDDVNVVAEGLAWYLHRVASDYFDYTPGLASWVTVTVNEDFKGVYVNVEQRDKQFLKNHGLWEKSDHTWLYKYSSPDEREVKESPEDEAGDEIDSPAFTELCYSPFHVKHACPAPPDFKDRLNALINMEGLLTFGAVSAFHVSPDDLFAKAKNYFIVDYSSPELGKREYFQWDLDSAFHKPPSIYNQGKRKSDHYEAELVQSPSAPFRTEYQAIMRWLLDGPFREADLLSAMHDIELAIGAAVDADPNHQLSVKAKGKGTPSAREFKSLRNFISKRIQSIRDELDP